MEYFIYKVVATLLPRGVGRDSVNYELGVFSTLKRAEKQLQEFVEKGNLHCPVYSYSIEFLPLNDDLEYSSGRLLNIYSPDGELQISEVNAMSGSVLWGNKEPFHIRAVIDNGPKQKAYFLLFNHREHGLATKCARISFQEPDYELGTFYNKSVWFLTKREKERLMDFLKSPITKRQGETLNCWQAAIWTFNNEVEPESRGLSYKLPIPDYTKLEP